MRAQLLALLALFVVLAGATLWLWGGAERAPAPVAGAARPAASRSATERTPGNDAPAFSERGTVLGVIVGADQTPVEHATVALYEPGSTGMDPRWLVAQTVVGPADAGRFAVPNLPRHRTWRGMVLVPGFAPRAVALTTDRLERIVLGGTATVAGRVSATPEGTPLSDVALWLELDGQLPEWGRTRSDPDGRFALPRLAVGAQPVLWTQRPGGAPEPTPLVRLEEQHYWLDVLLPATEPYRAQVIDAETRLPLPDAEITARVPVLAARVGRDGSFVVALRRDRPTTLVARAPGHLPVEWSAQPGTTPPDTVALPRGGTIDGAVHDRSGRPLAGARLTLTAEPPGADGGVRAGSAAPHLARLMPGTQLAELQRWIIAASDAAGGFRLEGVASRTGLTRVRVCATLPGYCPATSEPLDLDIGQAGVQARLCLKHATPIRGRVLITSAPPDALITAHHAGGQASTRTDAAGDFALEDLPPGIATVTAVLARRPWVSARTTLELHEDQPAHVELPLTLTDAQLAGRVLDAQLRPVPGARVQVHCLNPLTPDQHSTRAGDDGSWRLSVAGDQTTPLRVVAFAPTGLARCDDAVLGGPPLTLRFERPVTLRLAVRDEQDDTPIARCQVAVHVAGLGPEPLAVHELQLGPGRDASLEVPPVPLELVVTGAGYAPWRKAVAEPTREPLVVRLRRGD